MAGVVNILTTYMPAALEDTGYPPFVDIGTLFTGVMDNPPEAWVDGVRTRIDDEGNSLAELHSITIKFGVTATDPSDIAAAVVAYMKAITDAIAAAQPADWGVITPNHAHVFEHDYGPLFVKGSILARFPECHLEVEVNEVG